VTDPTREVLVLGGGPGGCAAACLLRSWGHHVLLRTRPLAADDRLAESVPPSTGKLFDLLGWRTLIDDVAVAQSTGNTVWWGSSAPRVEHFARGALGWQVSRAALERQLLSHVERTGVEVQYASVDRKRLDIPSATFVLDCTGRAGLLARRRGLRIAEPTHRSIALTAVWEAGDGFQTQDPTHTLIESYEGGWAWSVPESATTRIVAVMVDPSTSGLTRGTSARDVYLNELARTVQMRALSSDALLIDGPSGWDASMYYALRYVDDNVLLVGDAASFVDPLSSAGVKKAIASGWLAAVAVHTSLRRPAMREVALEFYAAREAEMYAALLEQTRRSLASAASGHAHPFWAERQRPSTDGTGPDIEAAFNRLRHEPELRVQMNPDVRVEARAAVSGTEIVLEERVVSRECPQGIRYVSDVDVVALVQMAPTHNSVPALFDAYMQRHAPVALPDFLAALSRALADKWLLWV
jgi:flavin-dependent dehydrogenase